MAVLVEAISVIVLKSSVERLFDGGVSAFLGLVPNNTLCRDEELFRIGFMMPTDAEAFVTQLKERGLTFADSGECIDIAVVDQMRGSTLPCGWLQFARVPFHGPEERISICWYFGGEKIAEGLHLGTSSMNLSVPVGWQYEGSISQKVGFVESSEVQDRLEFLRREDGMLVYRDRDSGKEVYVARTE